MKLLLPSLMFVSLASAQLLEEDGPMLRGRQLEIVLDDGEGAIEPDEVMTLYVDGEEGIYEVDGDRRRLSHDDDDRPHKKKKINIVINNVNKCKNKNKNSNSLDHKKKHHHKKHE